MGFTGIDVTIVIIYMLVSMAIGARVGGKQHNTTDYFLGGRNIPWQAVTLSIVATETSVLTFISIPAVAYRGDLTFIQIVFGYMAGRVLVALFLIPAYYKGEVETAYDFLGKKFGEAMRKTASITFMGTRILADGVRLFATAIPLSIIIKGSGLFADLSDTDFYAVSIVVIGLLTMVYTYIGGIKSVIWMDVIQMGIYIAGACLALIVILGRLPDGFTSIREFAVESDKLRWFNAGFGMVFREFIRQPYTFFTALTAGAIFSMASHGTDQLIIQRVLTCRDQRASQKAMMTSGVVIFFQFILFLFLGAALYAFYGGVSPEELGLTRADGIFPKFIVEELPVGLSGLIVASLFAAAMSTLSSSLSSLSSAAVLDIYKPLTKGNKNEDELLRISRLVTLGWGVVLIATAFAFIGLKGTVVEVALGIASYTYGGILGAFLLGMIFKTSTQRDAILGFITAIIIMAVVIRTVQIAWPLYTVVGSCTVIVTGFASNRFSGFTEAWKRRYNN